MVYFLYDYYYYYYYYYIIIIIIIIIIIKKMLFGIKIFTANSKPVAHYCNSLIKKRINKYFLKQVSCLRYLHLPVHSTTRKQNDRTQAVD
jgi:hypothetical protein